jgi:glutamyl-tRNA synthetase
VAKWLEVTNRELPKVTDWTTDKLQDALTDLREELDLVPKQYLPVLREALTGAPHTPAIWDLMVLFGRKETLARLEAAQALVA